MPPNFTEYWAAIKAGDLLAAKQPLQGKKCQTVLDNGMGPERDADGNLLPPQPKFQIKSISAAEWEAYRAKHYGNSNKEADKKQDKGKKGCANKKKDDTTTGKERDDNGVGGELS